MSEWKKNPGPWIVVLVFGIIGIVFLVVGIAIGLPDIVMSQNGIETQGVITSIDSIWQSDGDWSHRVQVSYEAEGVSYTTYLNYYSSSMREGQNIAIHCNPENPEEITTGSLGWIFLLIFGGLGLIFLVVAVIIVLTQMRKKRRREELFSSVTPVEAEIVDISRNTSVRVNGRYPFVITVEWHNPDDGKLYRMRTPSLWSNPQSQIERLGLRTLPVYIDPYDAKNYYVQTEILEKDVVEL